MERGRPPQPGPAALRGFRSLASQQTKAQQPVLPLGHLHGAERSKEEKGPCKSQVWAAGTEKLQVKGHSLKGEPPPFLLAKPHLFLCIWGRVMMGRCDVATVES